MRERPILMSGPLVRAVLDGRKIQTRRVVKGGPWERVFRDAMTDHTGDPDYLCLREGGTGTVVRSPYGQVGDRLWVRETWAPLGDVLTEVMGRPRVYRADADLVRDDSGDRDGWWCGDVFIEGARQPWRWTPSIHMPRWASRLSLVITDVRVERLQDISEVDAIAEGVEPVGDRWRDYMPEREAPRLTYATARNSFFSLWESAYGPPSLVSNPWVWCISFEREVTP